MIEVRATGLLATVQDLGRPGWAHLGVPRSGALDPLALRLANRLVGNDEGAAGIEFTLTGGTILTRRAVTVAVTGATARIRVDGRDHGHATAIPVRAGALVTIGPALAGARAYLAVSGGIEVDPVLGSRSTDTLSGLGPAPLRAGDVLPTGTDHGTPAAVDFVPGRPAGGMVEVRVRLGPRDDWFTDGARRAMFGTTYTVSEWSNRVGARLAGAPLARVAPGRELPSEPVVLGAVQVTADGTPLIFLADHPTTGGYPVIGVVDAADLPAVAQARPGDSVVFRPIGEGHRGSQR